MEPVKNRWQIGNVTVTRIIEAEVSGLPPERLSAQLTADRVKQFDWLIPSYAEEDGLLRLSMHAFVIESRGVRIIVDTCVGNDKPRVNPHWNMLDRPFLDNLAEAGFTPESIDYVLCTHLHVDHVGWNTRWDGTAWVPTFPNSKYLFAKVEWDHWTGLHPNMGDVPEPVEEVLQKDAVFADSILPVVQAGLHVLVEPNLRITDEVALFPTPGHTPGHVSVSIRSNGQAASITGDMAHHPIQIADPDVCSNFDTNRKLSTATRRQFIAQHCDKDILVLGTHFVTPSGGHIVSEAGGWRFVGMAGRADPEAG